jgi:hypothetical protein
MEAEATESGEWGPEQVIGLFQSLRPEGTSLTNIFEDVPFGDDLLSRMRELFAVAGNPRRPEGGMDAYFVVRKPTKATAEAVQQASRDWLEQLADLDRSIGDQTLATLLNAQPRIRVLEGQPPKHPRNPEERCELLNLITSLSTRLIDPLRPQHDAMLGLRQAYYFIACDTWLREYLMWPVYRELTGLEDPFEPYFDLWKAGVKFRIFNNQSIDFYMPRNV